VISTGSQGEPLSALRRMAYNDHRDVSLHSGDTVIFSATPIPGNERSVNETIDHIFQVGAQVVTARDAPIHASGHGWQEELKLMLNLTKPRYVFPFHGDHKRLRLHSQLAQSVGIAEKDTFIGKNGLSLDIDERGARFGEDVHASMIFVDGVSVGEPDEFALRDRRKLSDDGVFIVVTTISAEDGSQVAEPEVIFRGVPFGDDADGLHDELRDVVSDTLAEATEDNVREVALLQQDLHDDIAEFVYEKLRRRPLVLPVVVEV
jgi:ribonuclease J